MKELGESGVPKTRLKDAQAAHEWAQQVIRDNEGRNRVASLVKGLLDGNPPWSQGTLNRMGLKARSNFNTGQAEAVLDLGVTGYYDLFSEVPTYAVVETDDREEGEIVTEEFDWLQKQDPFFDCNMQLTQGDMLAYGSGPQVWDRPDGWQSRFKRHVDVLLPNETSSVLEDWEACLIVERMTTTQLYRYVAEPKMARRVGWRPDNVRDAILRVSRENGNWQNDWVEEQRKIRNNDLSYGKTVKRVRVGRVLYREYPTVNGEAGKITEKWVALDDSEIGFLYEREGRFDGWGNVIVPFMLNRGDGSYHSIKGIGRKMYRLMMAQERMYNQMTDLGFTMSSIHVQATTGAAVDQDSIRSLGPYTIVRNGLQPFNFNVTPGLEAASAVNQNMRALLQSNMAIYQPQVTAPQGNPRTAFEVSVHVAQQSVIQKTNIARYFQQLDMWYRERFRRALTMPKGGSREAKLAEEFRGRLRARKVTVAGLEERSWVSANRTVGQGSSFQRQQLLAELQAQVGPALPEAGKIELTRMIVAAKAGQKNVERLMPEMEVDAGIEANLYEARQELAMMKVGVMPVITTVQNHVVHVSDHLTGALQAADGLVQGANPMELMSFLPMVRQHATDHLAKITDVMRGNEVAKFQQMLEDLDKVIQGVAGMVKQRQAQADGAEQMNAEQQKTVMELELKKAEAEARLQIEGRKAAEENRRKEEAHRQEMAIKEAESRMKMRMEGENAGRQGRAA